MVFTVYFHNDYYEPKVKYDIKLATSVSRGTRGFQSRETESVSLECCSGLFLLSYLRSQVRE